MDIELLSLVASLIVVGGLWRCLNTIAALIAVALESQRVGEGRDGLYSNFRCINSF